MKGRAQLGLGCSKFGSLVGGVSFDEAQSLISAALDLGVRDFDTADVYGQGDSESFLGRTLNGVNGVRIITKAGQVFPLRKRMMIPLKTTLRPIIKSLKGAENAVARSRNADLPRNWSQRHLSSSLERSLVRLRREVVDIFLLHSPSAEILKRGDAMGVLEELKKAGKTIRIGASVDDHDALTAALADTRVEAVQFVLNPLHSVDPVILASARARGVILIAREILAGATATAAVDTALALARIQPVDVVLLGTRRIGNLRHAHAKFMAA